MARLKPVVLQEEETFIGIPEAGDKIDALYIPVTGRLVLTSEGDLAVDVQDLLDRFNTINQAVGGLISPGANFNDFKTAGLFDVPSGIYINQPPVTSDGTTLKAGALRVITGPDGSVFHEYLVWQAGETTGHSLGRGWDSSVDSWGNWV